MQFEVADIIRFSLPYMHESPDGEQVLCVSHDHYLILDVYYHHYLTLHLESGTTGEIYDALDAEKVA